MNGEVIETVAESIGVELSKRGIAAGTPVRVVLFADDAEGRDGPNVSPKGAGSPAASTSAGEPHHPVNLTIHVEDERQARFRAFAEQAARLRERLSSSEDSTLVIRRDRDRDLTTEDGWDQGDGSPD